MATEAGEGDMLDYNDGDAGAEQTDTPAEDGAAANPAEVNAAAGGASAAEDAAMQGADTQGGVEVQPNEANEAAAGSEAGQESGAGVSDPLSQPPHGTEVYIANLPMDATEAQVRSLASTAGEVFQLRLPKLPDGRNKGYGFIVYKTRESAENAVVQLANQEVEGFPGRKVRLNESQSKNKLYFGNLPRAYTHKQLEDELKKAVKGVETVELMMDKENPTLNRGFAFVTFFNYACADEARKRYTETAENTIGGRPVHTTWAEPKKQEDTSHVKSIFVGGLPDSVTEEKLQNVFKAYGEIDKVMLPYNKEDPSRYRDYGFVHFKERSSALDAVNKAQDSKPTVDGKELQVALARPQHASSEAGSYGGRGPGRGSYGGGYGSGYGSYGGGRGGPGRGYGRSSYGGYGGRGGGYGSGGYGASRGGYDDYGYGDDYGDYGEEDYSGGGGYGAGYGAPAAAAAAPVAQTGGSATMMVPVQLPSGQVGYMVVPAAGAAGGGGPMRRVVAGGYGTAATTAGAAAYAAAGYGRGASSYGYGARSSSGSGGQYRSHPY